METKKKKNYGKTLAEKLLEDRPKNAKVEEYKQLAKIRRNNLINDELLREGYQITFHEEKVISPPGRLWSRTTYQTPSLGSIDIERIPRCNACGEKIDEDYFVCYECELVVCPDCIIYWRGAYVCTLCIQNKIPFTKRAFKVLLAVANRITSTRRISKLSKIPRETVWEIMQDLDYAGLIELRGWIFEDYDVTDCGQQFIHAFGKIYAREGDVQQFLLAMDNYFWRK